MPGGANIYYLDFAPGTEVPTHRTPSTDYVIVVKGTLTVLSPSGPFNVVYGKGSYTEIAETIAREGVVVVQRGAMHAWANRIEEWIRLIGIVLGATPSQVDVAGGKQELGEKWLQ
ncbi:hypothetical protein VM1G_11327 [Cytospora mali]|uniref:Cupin 2 conserved barrel domain-containing protein n=1 Tax=Cytospora mali TaxID=578113 RepID=A0A194VLR5_CYTMA|nr:hypothetical protein VM1G_11327 [Valsa mali]